MPDSSNQNIPTFCNKLYERALAVLRSRNPPIRVVSMSKKEGAKCIYEAWMDMGGNERAEKAINKFLDDYSKYIDEIDKPLPMTVRKLFEYYNWLLEIIYELKEQYRYW